MIQRFVYFFSSENQKEAMEKGTHTIPLFMVNQKTLLVTLSRFALKDTEYNAFLFMYFCFCFNEIDSV